MIKLSGFVNFKTEGVEQLASKQAKAFNAKFEEGITQLRRVEDTFDAAGRIPDISSNLKAVSSKSATKLINIAWNAKKAVRTLRDKLENFRYNGINEAADDHDYSQGALESVKSYIRISKQQLYEATSELGNAVTVMKAWPSVATHTKVKIERFTALTKKLRDTYNDLTNLENDINKAKKSLTEAKIAPPSKELCNKAAAALEVAAKKEYDRNMKIWKKKGDDEVIKMSEDDYQDHCSIANLVRRGELSTAADAASDLDTGSRDVIPVKVYDFLMKYGA